VRSACPRDKVLLKVIIESGELQAPNLIRAACQAAITGGCDFVKTSTGKVKVNATLEAAEVMLGAIKEYSGDRTIGFKAAGGVKTVQDSQKYLELTAQHLLGDKGRWKEVTPRLFRFGASSLLAILRPLASGETVMEVEASGY